MVLELPRTIPVGRRSPAVAAWGSRLVPATAAPAGRTRRTRITVGWVGGVGETGVAAAERV
jgi:hypothetical protein